ncbi:MAG TPA: YggT family protein [Acidimicrobiales bacterium]|nr:YggT family protein [Acidimicrobiales bacterium]
MFLSILATLLHLYVIIIVVRILSTWIPVSPWSNFAKVVRVLSQITDPILNPLRRLIPPLRFGGMGIDLSPMILVLVLSLIANRL